MQEAKKNVILRVFRTAHCPPGKYFFGVTCSALSVLLSGVPFYTVYRIIRLFLLASLDGAAAPTHEIWMWAAVTIGSIVLGIVLSVIGSFSCHACAFNALYDLRMRLLDHMGRLNLGFYTGGQSGATQKMMNENIEKMENIIAHDVSNIFGAGLLLAALAVLMFSLNIPLALTIFIALVLAFLIQFSAFGGKQGQKIWSDLNRSSTELDAAFSEYVAGMEEEKIFGRPEAAARRLTGLVEKNREHWKVYLKRVTPIFGAYKTITISVLAFLLVSGCALLYLHPGDHELIPENLRFQRSVQRQNRPAEPLTADRERNRLRAGAGVPIVKGNAVAVLTATALPAYQGACPFPLRRGHAVKGTVRPAFQRRQVFVGIIFHAFPPFCFPLPFSPKRLPAPFLRRVPALARSPDFGTFCPEVARCSASPA